MASGLDATQLRTLQKALRACKVAGLGTALDVESAEQAPQVNLDGVLADL